MSAQDWNHALKGLPIYLCAWGGDDAPNVWTGKIVGNFKLPEKDVRPEALFDILIDGETKPREVAWGQVAPQ